MSEAGTREFWLVIYQNSVVKMKRLTIAAVINTCTAKKAAKPHPVVSLAKHNDWKQVGTASLSRPAEVPSFAHLHIVVVESPCEHLKHALALLFYSECWGSVCQYLHFCTRIKKKKDRGIDSISKSGSDSNPSLLCYYKDPRGGKPVIVTKSRQAMPERESVHTSFVLSRSSPAGSQ